MRDMLELVALFVLVWVIMSGPAEVAHTLGRLMAEFTAGMSGK